jgi:hypothetical protein
MNGMAEVLLEKRVDAQDRVLVALRLHDITYGQGADIAAILKVAGVDGLCANLIENLAAFAPPRKYVAGSGGFRAGDELVFVVFLGSADDAVPGDILDDLLYFAHWQRDIDDEPFPIG